MRDGGLGGFPDKSLKLSMPVDAFSEVFQVSFYM